MTVRILRYATEATGRWAPSAEPEEVDPHAPPLSVAPESEEEGDDGHDGHDQTHEAADQDADACAESGVRFVGHLIAAAAQIGYRVL